MLKQIFSLNGYFIQNYSLGMAHVLVIALFFQVVDVKVGGSEAAFAVLCLLTLLLGILIAFMHAGTLNVLASQFFKEKCSVFQAYWEGAKRFGKYFLLLDIFFAVCQLIAIAVRPQIEDIISSQYIVNGLSILANNLLLMCMTVGMCGIVMIQGMKIYHVFKETKRFINMGGLGMYGLFFFLVFSSILIAVIPSLITELVLFSYVSVVVGTILMAAVMAYLWAMINTGITLIFGHIYQRILDIEMTGVAQEEECYREHEYETDY